MDYRIMDIAFVFPGQGSQYVGMGRGLYENFSEAKEIFLQASEILGYDIARLCFEGPADLLDRTSKTQPAILTVSIATYRVFINAINIKPSVVAGHSLGEYTACVVANVVGFEDCLKIVEKRGLLMEEAVPEGRGLMAAILGLEKDTVDEICRSVDSGYVVPANYNCPGQIVISGEKEAVLKAIELARQRGAKRAVPLSVSVPSHCKLMEEASKRLGEYLNQIEFSPAEILVVNNVEAAFIREPTMIKDSLMRQLYSSVQWEDSVRQIYLKGINTFIEIGPGKVLSGLIKRTIPEARIFNIEDRTSLEKTMKELS